MRHYSKTPAPAAHALSRRIRAQPFDFVQFTYNIADRQAERRLLPMAADHGKAVVINRPLQGGALFERVHGQALPPFAALRQEMVRYFERVSG